MLSMGESTELNESKIELPTPVTSLSPPVVIDFAAWNGAVSAAAIVTAGMTSLAKAGEDGDVDVGSRGGGDDDDEGSGIIVRS